LAWQRSRLFIILHVYAPMKFNCPLIFLNYESLSSPFNKSRPVSSYKKLASFFFVKMNCIQLQVYLFLRSTSDWPGLAYWIQEIIFQNQCYICFNILLICGCIFLSLQFVLCLPGNRIMLFDVTQATTYILWCFVVKRPSFTQRTLLNSRSPWNSETPVLSQVRSMTTTENKAWGSLQGRVLFFFSLLLNVEYHEAAFRLMIKSWIKVFLRCAVKLLRVLIWHTLFICIYVAQTVNSLKLDSSPNWLSFVVW